MISARTITFTARIVLAVGSALVAVILLGPFQGAEHLVSLTDKQAHTLAFFTFAAVSFVAFPGMRRNDLALAAIALGIASEVAQTMFGRDGDIADVMADAMGVLMALAPTHIERIRRIARGESLPMRRRSDRRSRGPVEAASPTSVEQPLRLPAFIQQR